MNHILVILPLLFFLSICQAAENEPLRKYGNPGNPRPQYGYPPPRPKPTQTTTVPVIGPPPTTAPPVAPISTQPTTTQSSSSDSDELPPAILAFFLNDKRRKHGCPPVVIDPIYTEKAKKCANYYQATKEVTKNSNVPEDQPMELCDEAPEDASDIFGVAGEGSGGLIAMIDTWYKELTVPQKPATEVYNYKKPDLKNIVGYSHALQLVWKDTTKCGCGSSNKPIAEAKTDATASSEKPPVPGASSRKRSIEPEIPSDETNEEPRPILTYRAEDPTKAAASNATATAPQHVHVCVCDVSPNGRQANYIKNVPSPR